MEILFLGTGAADWPFEKTPEMTEFRRLSSALVDGVLLIDPGPQVPQALAEYGIRAEAVRYVLVTHRHDDHYCEQTVAWLTAAGATVVTLCDGEETQFGPYRVRACCGNHATCEKTVHFLITDGMRTLFYGLDGAWLLYGEVQAIRQWRPDVCVLDATVGEVAGDYRVFEHNNLAMVREIKAALAPYVKTFVISHMARTLHSDHASLAASMAKDGVRVAYDGMVLSL